MSHRDPLSPEALLLRALRHLEKARACLQLVREGVARHTLASKDVLTAQEHTTQASVSALQALLTLQGHPEPRP